MDALIDWKRAWNEMVSLDSKRCIEAYRCALLGSKLSLITRI